VRSGCLGGHGDLAVRHRKQQETAEKFAKYYSSDEIMEDERGGV